MSFGRPGGFGDTFKVSPPSRGSFPLDHDGELNDPSWALTPGTAPRYDTGADNTPLTTGDCKEFMIKHLKCMTENKGDVGKCRLESRRYLECRMDQYVDVYLHPTAGRA